MTALWANGTRLREARHPDTGFFRPEGFSITVTTNGVGKSAKMCAKCSVVVPEDVAMKFEGVSAEELARATVTANYYWHGDRRPIDRYDAKTRTFEVSDLSYARWCKWSPKTMLTLVGLRSVLDIPGEWLVDSERSRVLYIPHPGEQIGKVRFEAARPGLERLVTVTGDPSLGRSVRGIVFSHIDFAGSDSSRLHVHGSQAAIWCAAAIEVEGATGCRFDGCRITGTGEYALRLGAGCVSNAITSCVFSDLGAGGIIIGETRPRRHKSGVYRPKPGERISPDVLLPWDSFGNCVTNCVLEHAGLRYPEGVGILVGHSGFNRIVRNTIRDFRYTGISVGWVWGYSGSVAQENEIVGNLITDIGQGELADMGGIYLLGAAYGTRVSGNVIARVESCDYGGWGIYTDEGSEGVLIENNVVSDTRHGSFHQNYGKDNVIRNNLFVDGRENAFAVTRTEKNHCVFTAERNVIVSRYGNIFSTKGPGQPTAEWKNNVFWVSSGQDTAFNGKSFEEWKSETGHSEAGILADPLLVSDDKTIWSLDSRSPALRIGFGPIKGNAGADGF